MQTKLRRVGERAFFYVRQGYSVGAFPVSLLGFSSLIYYDLVVNVPFLHVLFPRYINFLTSVGFILIGYFGLVGYAYMKKLWFYRTASTVLVESNPYQTVKVAPVTVPMWRVLCKLAEKQGIDTSEVKKILERST